MPSQSDADSRAFAETRKALLDALDRTQQEAADQAAELVRRGERRAHEIIIESDQCAALIEEQLTYLTEQIEHVRVKMTEIRARLARESRSDKNIILASPPVQSRPVEQVAGPQVRSSVDQPGTGRDEDAQWRRPMDASDGNSSTTAVPSQSGPGSPAADSLHDTLRTLRSALESLSGQPQKPTGPGQ